MLNVALTHCLMMTGLVGSVWRRLLRTRHMVTHHVVCRLCPICILIASAQQIDAFVAKPTAEMVAWALQNHICKGDRKISVEIIDDAFIEKTDSWRQICDETEDDDFFNEDDWD